MIRARFRELAKFLVIVLMCAVVSPRALAGDGPKADADPAAPKEAPEQRMLGNLRQYMDLSDDEWKALLPYMSQVEMLTRQLRDLREGRKTFDLSKSAKPFKIPKELRGDSAAAGGNSGNTANASNLPRWLAALADVNDKATELRTMLQDKNSRPADIRAKLAAYRASRDRAEKLVTDELTKARAKLTELLTPRQELACVMSGLLE